jgi:lipopolysaccharide export system protein LptC
LEREVIVFGGIVILLVLVGGGIAFYLSKNKKPKATVTIENKPTSPIEPVKPEEPKTPAA